jgi:flagellar protein FliO/FliZ
MGSSISASLDWPVIVTIVVAVAIVAVVIGRARLRGGKRRPAGHGTGRLAVVDSLDVDLKRRLVVIRCDGTEHLLLLGAQGDVVVKADLTGAAQIPDDRPVAEVAPPGERDIAGVTDATKASARVTEAPVTAPPTPHVPTPHVPTPPASAPVTPSVSLFTPRPVASATPIAAERVAPEPVPPAPVPVPVAEDTPPSPVAPAPAPARPAPEFSEMTRKLEEALKRTAAQRVAAPAAPATTAPQSVRIGPRLDDMLATLGPAPGPAKTDIEQVISAPRPPAPTFTTADARKTLTPEPPLDVVPPRPTEPVSAPRPEPVFQDRSPAGEAGSETARSEVQAESPAAAVTPPEATRPPDPFEDEIRRLLGRDRDIRA